MPSLSGEDGGGPLVEVLLAMNKKVVGKARQGSGQRSSICGIKFLPTRNPPSRYISEIFQIYFRYILYIFHRDN